VAQLGTLDAEGRAKAPAPVIARLCEPASEPHIAEDWCRHTAPGDLAGLPGAAVNENRSYRGP
jgi:hypothetical protein